MEALVRDQASIKEASDFILNQKKEYIKKILLQVENLRKQV
jgi:hypothetical protein